MKEDEAAALLIRESPRSFTHIVKRLENAGCHCRFASSYEEAVKLVETEKFELVLSVSRSQEKPAGLLADRLAGSGATFFCAHPVEDGCWWLPALRHGERCYGRPALRPSEFAAELNHIISELNGQKPLEPETMKKVVVLADQVRPGAVGENGFRAQSKAAG